MSPTSLQQELDAQRRFQFRPGRESISSVLEANIHREFEPPAALDVYQDRRLSEFVKFAAAHVPYYEQLFRDGAIDPQTITDRCALRRLPILTKGDLQRNETQLIARLLPRGHRVRGWAYSTGTIGIPSRALMTEWANGWFSILSLRSLRWNRVDPMTKRATIRRGSRLQTPDVNTPVHRERWEYAGSICETGPETTLAYSAPIERQLEWLRSERPTYLRAYSQSLEHLALAAGELPVDSLRGVGAFAEQLSPAMRTHIENTFGLRVFQGYGLNEIGNVAARCPAGRYHVNIEHCTLEIVDDKGEPAPPGTTGRVLITGYNNHAMPLLRYDTGDLAEALDGACPCGRTLPSFGEISGRYQRIAHVPFGTMRCYDEISNALTRMSRDWIKTLRQFQVHQRRDMNMELRLVATAPLPPQAIARFHEAMAKARPDPAWELEIKYVDRIARRGGGKFEEFTSDFIPYEKGREAANPAFPSH